jgi:cysteine desulfurase
MNLRTPVYLDHHATTPIDPRVLETLIRVQRDHFGNPGSGNHAFGWAAARLVEEAREHVAALVGATGREIIFTSGATEANNLALWGVLRAHAPTGGQLVISNLEHEAVAAPAAALVAAGYELAVAPADSQGRVAAAAVQEAMTERTVLVSVIAAQNEIGTIQPVADIGRLCKERGILFHTDAVQAAGRIDLDVEAMGIDLLSLSAHKVYGPKGVGALYVRRKNPRVRLQPLLYGGDQERGWRPGTLNVPGIAAMGEACRLARAEMVAERTRLEGLRDRLLGRLETELTGVVLNGARAGRLAGNLNLSFGGVRAHSLLGALTVLAVSSSSACTRTDSGPSAILTSLGVPDDLARASLRIGLGRFTTTAEVDFAAATIIAAVTKLRAS